MDRFQDRTQINKVLADTYTKRFLKFGATPEGSYWLNASKQNLRFKILLEEVSKISRLQKITLADVGCGSGALQFYIDSSALAGHVSYYGYDISKSLIDYCEQRIQTPNATFHLGDRPHLMVDFCLMSGTYNLTTTRNVTKWETHLYSSLSKCWERTKTAMIFNLQSDQEGYISKGNIYYCKVSSVLSRCREFFGPTVCVHHELLSKDATFIVRK